MPFLGGRMNRRGICDATLGSEAHPPRPPAPHHHILEVVGEAVLGEDEAVVAGRHFWGGEL